MSKITSKDIIEARMWIKATEAEPCVKCGKLTIFGICQPCQNKNIDEFCETMLDDFLWSKWFGGYIK